MPLRDNWKSSAKRVRHTVRRAAAAVRQGRSLANAPVLFANSFPKSGTHLLTQVLSGLTKLGPAVDSGLPAVVTFEGPTGKPRPSKAILADLARYKPGDIGYGHLHGNPEILEALCREGVAPFFIFRDPRDVVVSHAHYVTEIEPDHVHHAYYRSLPDFEARLRTSILGRPDLEAPFPDIRARFAPYLPWLTRPEVCTLRFETFIQDRDSALARVIAHVVSRGFIIRRSFREADSPGENEKVVGHAIRTLGAGIDPKKSPTFRTGKTGAWREKFSEANKTLFKETAGDLLVELGYEQSEDW